MRVSDLDGKALEELSCDESLLREKSSMVFAVVLCLVEATRDFRKPSRLKDCESARRYFSISDAITLRRVKVWIVKDRCEDAFVSRCGDEHLLHAVRRGWDGCDDADRQKSSKATGNAGSLFFVF